MSVRTIRMASLILIGVLAASYAEMKIGFINSQQIFKEYEGTKEAQAKFDKEVARWEQEASKRKKEIEELKQQLEKQSLLLSAERKKELEDRLREKYMAYQEFLQSKLGQDGEVLQKNVELTKPIIERINKIIANIAEEERYDFIFDEANGGVVFAKKGYDLTERVLRILNEQG